MNLKKYLDAVNAAEARVQQIAAQIDTHFEAGENDQAVALRPQLDEAKNDASKANALYLSMLNATGGGSDPAQRFIPAGGAHVVTDEADQPMTPGEFFQAVKIAGLYPGREDPRLRPLRVRDATGLSEGVPADGGYLLQPTVASGILERMYNTGEILGRVASDPIGGGSNSMTYNGIDETSRVNGSQYGGVTAYWLGEGSTITASKPKFRQIELKLKKVAALCYATDEQLEDLPNLESWLNRVVPNVLRFRTEDAIYNGDGVGKPLGIMSSPCLVSQLRVDASKIQLADVVGMWARRWAGVNDYAWFINQDALPQLMQLGSTYQFVWMPPGGLSSSPYAMLMGKPVIEVEYAATLGTTGDIMLASMSQYQTINKGGVKTASSIHVQFVTDETAFRFVYRIDGQPTWHAALTPANGTSTLSPFVVLTSASV
jgi:HK97 family phage major capsid protein